MNWNQKEYDKSKTKEEIAAHMLDPRVDASQYRDLVHYWCSEKGHVYMYNVTNL